MGRRHVWRQRLLLAVLLLVTGYAWLAARLPVWASQQLRRVTGGSLTVGHIHLGFPLTLVLSNVVLGSKNPGATIACRQMVLRPLWVSWGRKTVWLRRLDLVEPAVHLRRTQQGTLLWPTFEGLLASGSPEALAAAAGVSSPSWTLAIQTVQALGGTIDLVDERLATPFRGAVTELAIAGGPMTFPGGPTGMAMSIQGRVIGAHQHTASAYCTGWLNLEQRSLDISCRLEPLRLAAFEPYYQGPLQVRVYDATIQATSQFTAKANQLDGRINLEIGNLSEGDLSLLGTTLMDVKTLSSGSEPVLSGEIQIVGPLDQPGQWRFQLVPGNDIVKRLVSPLFDRGIGTIRVKVGQQTIQVGLTPPTEEAMSSAEATGKAVEEQLGVLAPTPPVPEAPVSEPSQPPAPAEPTEPAPAPARVPPGPGPAPAEPASATSTPQPPSAPVPLSEAPQQAAPPEASPPETSEPVPSEPTSPAPPP